MASSYLEVGSEGLKNLKDDLTKLSQSLHEVFELMNADMRQVGEAWRDGKYEEFVSGYRPQINKCEEISERYTEWCKRVLDPAIEECEDIETTDVGGDGGGSGSGVGSSGPASSSTTQTPKQNKFLDAQRRMNNPSEAERPRSPQQPWPYNQQNHYDPSKLERPRSPQQPWPYNQQNHYDPSKLERPRSPQPQPWPYNQQRPTPPTGTASSSKPIKPVPPKPSDSGFDTPQNVRQPLSPAEIAMLEKLYGRGR